MTRQLGPTGATGSSLAPEYPKGMNGPLEVAMRPVEAILLDMERTSDRMIALLNEIRELLRVP